MTVQELADYYSNLLVIQYRGKPKAQGTIDLFAKCLLADNLIFDCKTAYNLETAIGTQLDVLGSYVGIDRKYEGENLDDDDFRFLIKLKIVQNASNHSYKQISDDVYNFFAMSVIPYSSGLMNITYFIENNYSDIIQIAYDKGVLPRPMGVKIGTIIERIPDQKVFWFARSDKTYANPLIQGGFGESYFPKVIDL